MSYDTEYGRFIDRNGRTIVVNVQDEGINLETSKGEILVSIDEDMLGKLIHSLHVAAILNLRWDWPL